MGTKVHESFLGISQFCEKLIILTTAESVYLRKFVNWTKYKTNVTYKTGYGQSLECGEQGDNGVEWNHRRLHHFWPFLCAKPYLKKSIADS